MYYGTTLYYYLTTFLYKYSLTLLKTSILQVVRSGSKIEIMLLPLILLLPIN